MSSKAAKRIRRLEKRKFIARNAITRHLLWLFNLTTGQYETERKRRRLSIKSHLVGVLQQARLAYGTRNSSNPKHLREVMGNVMLDCWLQTDRPGYKNPIVPQWYIDTYFAYIKANGSYDIEMCVQPDFDSWLREKEQNA